LDTIRYKLGLVDGVKGTGVFRNFKLGSFAAEDAPEAAAGQSTAATDEFINGSDVVVFVSSSCPYCSQAVDAIKAEGIEVTVVERTPEMKAALLAKTGKASVPSAWVKGTYIGGCNDGPEDWMGVVPMVRSGKLDEMLSA
jgi:glutaredoxin 3